MDPMCIEVRRARRAIEQGDLQFIFQRAHLLADGGRRDEQTFGCVRKTLAIGDCHERSQLDDVHANKLSNTKNKSQ